MDMKVQLQIYSENRKETSKNRILEMKISTKAGASPSLGRLKLTYKLN